MRILADEFGRLRGWVRAKTPFSLAQLAGRTYAHKGLRVRPLSVDVELVPPNAVFYREAEPRGSNRPAGIAIHVYSWPEIGPDIERACVELGLKYEAVEEFPSWIPHARLLVLTPALSRQAGPVQLELWGEDEALRKIHRRK